LQHIASEQEVDMRCLLAVLAVMVATAAWGSPKEDERQKALSEQHRRCIEACVKPAPRVGKEEDVWTKNLQDESHYDNCVHNCDRKLLKGFRK
jgi:hypothetical protein